MSFDTSLLREKFLIKEDGVDKEHHRVVSNRLVLKFKDDKDKAHKFIVRAQTMHNCIRLAARIMQAFQRGTIAELTVDKAKWKDIWTNSLSHYDQNFNPNLWALVYHDGENIFSSGAPHAFLDMIERCDASSRDEYDASNQNTQNAPLQRQVIKLISRTKAMSVLLLMSRTTMDAAALSCVTPYKTRPLT